MSIFRLGLQTLEYRPRYVSYIVASGNLRPKYDYSDLESVGFGTAHFSHKKAFVEHVMTWPIATQSLYEQLIDVPINKTIELYDDVDNITKNIQILKRTIIPLKTMANELLYTITFTFRLVE